MKTNIQLSSQLSYDKRTDRFTDFVLPAPLSLCYKVTKKCNLRCHYCIASSCPEADYGLNTTDAKRIIKKVSDNGVRRIDFTGGEPFIRNDMMELLEYSASLGLETVVTTNGFYVTEDIANRLKNINCLVQVSIDGNKDRTNKIRGKGAYEAAFQAASLLTNINVPVRINCVLQKRFKSEIESIMLETISFAKEVNASNVYFILVCAQGRASKSRKKVCFTKIEEPAVRSLIQKYRESETNLKVKMLDFRQYTKACVLVDTYGEFISQGWSDEECTMTGNVLTDSMEDLWINSGAFDHAIHLLQYIRHPVLYK